MRATQNRFTSSQLSFSFSEWWHPFVVKFATGPENSGRSRYSVSQPHQFPQSITSGEA